MRIVVIIVVIMYGEGDCGLKQLHHFFRDILRHHAAKQGGVAIEVPRNEKQKQKHGARRESHGVTQRSSERYSDILRMKMIKVNMFKISNKMYSLEISLCTFLNGSVIMRV